MPVILNSNSKLQGFPLIPRSENSDPTGSRIFPEPSAEASSELTEALQAWNSGDQGGQDRLIELVYRELRRLAAILLTRERSSHTLQPTALVHEAYLQLASYSRITWQNRNQFYGLAAQAMRRVLVDHARARDSQKRGGQMVRLSLASGEALQGLGQPLASEEAPPLVELLDLDDALSELGRMDPSLVKLVELRHFAGLTIEETAETLGISPATVKRDWLTARAWLHRRLTRHTVGS